MPCHFVRYFESKWGGGFYWNIQLDSTIHPHKQVDAVRVKTVQHSVITIISSEQLYMLCHHYYLCDSIKGIVMSSGTFIK